MRQIDVRTYAGYRGAERPCQVVVRGELIDVKEIVARWRDPDYEYFKVTLANGEQLTLRHVLDESEWVVITTG